MLSLPIITLTLGKQGTQGVFREDGMSRPRWVYAVPEQIAILHAAAVGGYLRHDAGSRDIGETEVTRIGDYLVEQTGDIEEGDFDVG